MNRLEGSLKHASTPYLLTYPPTMLDRTIPKQFSPQIARFTPPISPVLYRPGSFFFYPSTPTSFAHSLAHEACSTTLQTPQAYPTIPTLETQQTEVAKHGQTTARVAIAEPKPVATAQVYFHVSNGQGGGSDRSGTWAGLGSLLLLILNVVGCARPEKRRRDRRRRMQELRENTRSGNNRSISSKPPMWLYISMGWVSLGKDGKFDWLNDRWFVGSFARERMGR